MPVHKGFREFRVSVVILVRKAIPGAKDRKAISDLRVLWDQ